MNMQSISDLDRRLANLLRYGVIAELDENHADGPRATVDLDDGNITDWLPWFAMRAGEDRSWWAPEPGEQVMVFSPSGELSQGTIMPGIYCNKYVANGASKDVRRTTYKDGTVVEYDRAAHQLLVDASASNGAVVVNVGTGTVTVNCSTATVNATDSVQLATPLVHCTQKLRVDGDTELGGKLAVTGAATLSSTLGVSGSTTLASVTSNGKNVGSTHVHPNGTPNTGTPV